MLDQTTFSNPPVTVEPTLSATLAPSREEVTVPTETVAISTKPASHAEPDETRAETGEAKVESAASEETVSERPGIDEAIWFGPEPEAEPEPDGWLRPFWSHPTIKLALFVVVATMIVLGVIVGLRHFATNNSGSGPSLTTTTHSSSRGHHGAFAPPISSAELTQYEGYATALQDGNAVASAGFAKAGSAPTASQLVLVVVGYQNAVKTYGNDLSLIQWPASMQSTIATDRAQFLGLESFLQSFSTLAPSDIPTWLAELRNRASSTEAVDNVVRKDLGLTASSSFP